MVGAELVRVFLGPDGVVSPHLDVPVPLCSKGAVESVFLDQEKVFQFATSFLPSPSAVVSSPWLGALQPVRLSTINKENIKVINFFMIEFLKV